MLLLLIFGIGLIIGIGLLIFDHVSRDFHDGAQTAGGILTIICGFLTAVSVITLAGIYILTPGTIEADKMRYEMLTYQWENGFYDNDNDVGKQELVDQIRAWNENLATGKRMQHDIWVGAFVPDVFDQYEFISLDENPRQPEVEE